MFTGRRRKTIDPKELRDGVRIKNESFADSYPQSPAASVAPFPSTELRPRKTLSLLQDPSDNKPETNFDQYLPNSFASSSNTSSFMSKLVNESQSVKFSTNSNQPNRSHISAHLPTTTTVMRNEAINCEVLSLVPKEYENPSWAIHSQSQWVAIGSVDSCLIWCSKKKIHPVMYHVNSASLSNADPQNLLLCFTSSSLDSSGPGLFAVHYTGLIRFWENVAFGNDRYQDITLNLEQNDYPISVVSCEPAGFIIATFKSLVFKVSLYSPTGQPQLSLSGLTRPKNLVESWFTGASASIDSDPILSVIPSAKIDARQRELFILTQKSLTKWLVSRSPIPDKFTSAIPLNPAIATQLGITDPIEVDYIDMYYSTQSGILTILAEIHDANRATSFLGLVEATIVNSAVEKISVKKTRYQPDYTKDLKIGMCRGAVIIYSRSVVVVVGDADEEVIMVSKPMLGVKSSEEVAFLLTTDWFLGLQVEKSSVSRAGVKKSLEQCVFYGDVEVGYPFVCDMKSGAELSRGVLEVSESVINSRTPHLAQVLDLRSQLAEKLHRLDRIIEVVSEHGLLDSLNSETRFNLFSNAQKVSAAISLWQYQNHILGRTNISSESRILAKAIELYMQEVEPTSTGDDNIRRFFTHHIANIGLLLKYLQMVIKREKDNITESNRAILLIFKSAMQYDSTKYRVENDDDFDGFESWL
ncbi:hypothetical protein HK098_003796, partial [Nowakowskiella sp. JEL0407]